MKQRQGIVPLPLFLIYVMPPPNGRIAPVGQKRHCANELISRTGNSLRVRWGI